MIELAHLLAFVRIADLRSVSGAAKALGAPKSSVSRALMRLEREVGAALVERSSRHLRLTDAGALFYPHARRILDDMDDAQRALSDYAGEPTGSLKLNLPTSFARCIVAPMLPAFLARYPGIRIDLVVSDERIDMRAAEIDLTIRIGPLPDSDLVARRLRSTELWACASTSYLSVRGTPTTASDLAGHDLIGPSDRMLKWLTEGSQELKLSEVADPRVATIASDIVIAILVGGGGIGRLPDYLAKPALERGELVRLFPEIAPERVAVHALYPSHRSISSKVRVFIDALVHSLGE